MVTLWSITMDTISRTASGFLSSISMLAASQTSWRLDFINASPKLSSNTSSSKVLRHFNIYIANTSYIEILNPITSCYQCQGTLNWAISVMQPNLQERGKSETPRSGPCVGWPLKLLGLLRCTLRKLIFGVSESWCLSLHSGSLHISTCHKHRCATWYWLCLLPRLIARSGPRRCVIS